MPISVKERLRRVRTIERHLHEKVLMKGSYVIVSDADEHTDTRTGCTLEDEALERLRQRGYQLVWRMIPPGFYDKEVIE